jgi:branched-chain amino acid aminotransferase
MWVFLNDRFVDRKEAMVSVFDHGFLYGDGIYETLRAYNGRIFMLRRHLERLYRSGDRIGLAVPIPLADWPGLLQEAMQRNGLTDAYLRITVSRGEGDIGLDPHLCPRPTVVIMAKPAVVYPGNLYTSGVDLVVVEVRRNLSSALPPQVKSLNFLNNILAKHEATHKGAFDGVMLNVEGYVTECTASNLFFMKNGTLHTPSVDCGILDGITREVILLLAREHQVPTEEGSYREDRLLGADECFLTNTSMELMPVREVNRQPIGAGKPGPLTHRLRVLFQTNLERFLDQ